jgi:ketosteroid isomerase-like protein
MNPASEKLIQDYFRAIENSIPSAELGNFLHDEIRQTEFPSRLNPKGRTRGKAEMLADFERGKALVASQSYRIRGLVSDGDRVCAETEWTGTLVVPLGTLKPGEAIRAEFGVFFRLRDGRIVEQNNYDCIHPW